MRGRESPKTLLQSKAKKNPAPLLSRCQVFSASALQRRLRAEGAWGRRGVPEMFLVLLFWGTSGNNNTCFHLKKKKKKTDGLM